MYLVDLNCVNSIIIFIIYFPDKRKIVYAFEASCLNLRSVYCLGISVTQ